MMPDPVDSAYSNGDRNYRSLLLLHDEKYHQKGRARKKAKTRRHTTPSESSHHHTFKIGAGSPKGVRCELLRAGKRTVYRLDLDRPGRLTGFGQITPGLTVPDGC